MKSETLNYQVGNTIMQGYLAYKDDVSKRPAVLIAHTWNGLDDFVREKTLQLASLGYLAFALDLFGNGKIADNDDDALKLITPLFKDRSLLQERIKAGFDLIYDHPLADKKRIGAIGFCFGGLSVIELLRSGVDVLGVVSFHGVLGDNMNQLVATPGIRNRKINGSLLVLHGASDPLVTEQDILNLEKEMNDNGADWQIHIYGNTMHAFMNENAHKPEHGLVYNPRTAKRAWESMINFFNEIFG